MNENTLELWGGLECTVNRVGDRWRDQLKLTGSHDRLEDLDLIAGLGIKALRFPVLWERVWPDPSAAPDWAWSDERVALLEQRGVRPIIGLLHHGSGPGHTSLVADNFVTEFARYAGLVARRYPHVRDWTPINEPVTTARFSCLYGTWFPHACDTGQFWRAILNQVEGTVAAMAAIREVIPDARLVQTDDLGVHLADPAVQDIADYYNARRWLGWDLLTGRVDQDHPLWPEAEWLGFADRVLRLKQTSCPPAVIGVNHYPTSDRYLRAKDAHAYAHASDRLDDLAALRIVDPAPPGLAGALTEAWERYGLPVAVTETHLGCTREEQLRWVKRSWDTCLALRGEGVDVQALTAWALFGNRDWVNLLTADSGHYEPGAFDARGGAPRPTAVARLLASLGKGEGEGEGTHHAAIARGRGWWERDVRLEHPPAAWNGGQVADEGEDASPPILITGATGTLGQALAGACRLRGLSHLLTDRTALPIDDRAAIERVLDQVRPWAVINAAGWVRVDDAEGERDACYRANSDGAAALAAACAGRGIHCTLFSSDLVFGDDGARPRDEGAGVGPLNVYGASKAAAEARARHANPDALVIRTAAFFSPFDRYNFAMWVEDTLRRGETVRASAEHVVTPTYVPELVKAVLDLVIDGETGLWHLANEEPVSWWEFGRHVAQALGLDPAGVVPAGPEALGWRARRPRYAALRSDRGRLLPSLDHALSVHAAERRRATAGAEHAQLEMQQ